MQPPSGVEEGVRLAAGERGRRARARQGQTAEGAPDGALVPRPHGGRDGERQEQGERAELGCDRQTDGGAGRRVRRRPAALDDLHHERQREQDQERERHVVGGEVGVLDVQHRAREQRAGEQAGPRAVEPPPQQDEQQHRAGPPQRRERPAGEDRAVIGGEPAVEVRERGRGQLRHVEREGAVGEEVRVELQRVERELGHRLGDAPFVGVVEVGLVEVEADDADGESENEQRQDEAPVSGQRRVHRPRITPRAWLRRLHP